MNSEGSKVSRREVSYLGAISAVVVAVMTYSVMLGDGHTIFVFAGKEQLFEHLSAWLFLLACLFALGAAQFSRRRRAPFLRQLAFFGLGAFFFLAFGEELSWGQHYLGYATPGALQGLNQQGEVNLHNLSIIDSRAESGGLFRKLFNSNRLFDYFMIGLFLIVPLGERFWPWGRRLLENLSAPVITVILGLPLVLNWVLTVVSETWIVTNEFRHMATSEIRELNYAWLCALGLFWLFRREKEAWEETPAP